MSGRRIGPLATSAGSPAPTGRHLELRVIDVLTLTDGRISDVWMVADWLTALTAAGVVQLSDGVTPSARTDQSVGSSVT